MDDNGFTKLTGKVNKPTQSIENPTIKVLQISSRILQRIVDMFFC